MDTHKTCWDARLKGLVIFTYSMPMFISSLPEGKDKGFVDMQGIFHGSYSVLERAVLGLFGSVQDLTTHWHWAPLYFGQSQAYPPLNEYAAFRTFLSENSLGGLDPFSVDYVDEREARQLLIQNDEERAKAWKFEDVIDVTVTHHTDVITARGENLWKYFRLYIPQRIPDWTIKNARFDQVVSI